MFLGCCYWPWRMRCFLGTCFGGKNGDASCPSPLRKLQSLRELPRFDGSSGLPDNTTEVIGYAAALPENTHEGSGGSGLLPGNMSEGFDALGCFPPARPTRSAPSR